MTASAPLISLSDVSCQRGGRDVFAGVSLEISPGAAIELQGPNGVGKTSLLRMIAGLLDLVSGRIDRAAGVTVAYLPPHDQFLKPRETVAEALAFWTCPCAGRGPEVFKALGPCLRRDTLGIQDLYDRQIRTLSAGQRRRVALAALLAQDAKVWLLDEPFNALDAASAEAWDNIVTAHLAAGGAVVVAGHHAPRAGAKIVNMVAA